MKKRNILVSDKGFTLSELLISCIIIIFISIMLISGVSLASDAYFSTIDRANASTLLSTTMHELRNELANAKDVSVEDNAIIYTSLRNANRSRIENGEDNKGIKLYEYIDIDPPYEKLLVSYKAAAEKLHCEYGEVSIEEDILIIKDLVVKKGERILLSQSEYLIKLA